jgi:putative heme-binding domain-containing protein
MDLAMLEASGQNDISQAFDRQLQSTRGALGLLVDLYSPRLSPASDKLIVARGIACPIETSHDLFRTYDPAEQTRIRLGPNINPVKLLATKGDAARGHQVFFGAGPAATGLCSRCHKIDDQGTDFGPDLSHIASKYNRSDLLDNILHPSKTILPGFETYVCRTKDGDTYSGFMAKKTDQEIVLKDAQLKLISIKTDDIDKLKAQSISAMPEGLLGDLDPQQAADLVAYLVGCH